MKHKIFSVRSAERLSYDAYVRGEQAAVEKWLSESRFFEPNNTHPSDSIYVDTQVAAFVCAAANEVATHVISELFQKYGFTDPPTLSDFHVEEIQKRNVDEPLTLASAAFMRLQIPKQGRIALMPFKEEAAALIAQRLNERLQASHPLIEAFVVSGHFINIKLKYSSIFSTMRDTLLQLGRNYGKSDIRRGQQIVEDYSSPNAAKPFSVAHLRSTFYGQALKMLAKTLGANVAGVNHVGDWGSQFGLVILAYLRSSEKSRLHGSAADAINYLKSIYVDISARVKRASEPFKAGAEKLKERENPLVQNFNRVFDSVQAELGAFNESNLARHRAEAADQLMAKKAALFYAFEKSKDQGRLDTDAVAYLSELFEGISREVETARELKAEAQQTSERLETLQDDELLALWKIFREISLAEVRELYDRHQIDIELTLGESFYLGLLEQVYKDAIQAGITVVDSSNGALIVKLPKEPVRTSGVAPLEEEFDSEVLRRGDGVSLYLSRDLATLKYRMATFEPSEILYVVGDEQSRYFQFLFRVARRLGYVPDNVKLTHTPFGMLKMGGEKMSTRAGRVVTVTDMVKRVDEQVIQNTYEKIQKRLGQLRKTLADLDKHSPTYEESYSTIMTEIQKLLELEVDRDQIHTISSTMAHAAIVHNDLNNPRMQTVNFDIQALLDDKVGSSAELAYAGVRCKSLLAKAQYAPRAVSPVFSSKAEEREAEIRLVQKLYFFMTQVKKALEQYEPVILMKYFHELAQAFNHFYAKCDINRSGNGDLKQTRLDLVRTTLGILENGLRIFGIEIPDKM